MLNMGGASMTPMSAYTATGPVASDEPNVDTSASAGARYVDRCARDVVDEPSPELETTIVQDGQITLFSLSTDAADVAQSSLSTRQSSTF